MDLGEFIGGVMAGVARARRDADMTAAAIAEEYRLNSLLSQVPAPRIRLSNIELDIPVLLSSADSAATRSGGGAAMTPEGAVAALQEVIRRERDDRFLIDRFSELALRDMHVIFGGRVTDISGEAIARAAQIAFTAAHSEHAARPQSVAKKDEPKLKEARRGRKEEDTKEESKRPDEEASMGPGTHVMQSNEELVFLNRMRNILDIESRRIGREIESPGPSIQILPQTEMVRSMGTDSTVTRLKLKLLEEGLEWSTSQDEQGNQIGTLTPE